MEGRLRVGEETKFPLCEFCSKRQGAGLSFPPAGRGGKDCYICQGISEALDRVTDRVVLRLERYQFRTFSLGLVLPPAVQEREDTLRSDLRIRGGETIKWELANRISGAVAKRMRGRKVDRLHPDVTALIKMNDCSVEVASRPLLLYGRYTKPRGVAQRRSFCDGCDGAGCDRCSGTGYSEAPSVEGAVTKRLGALLGSAKLKFTWFGSEDVESVVLPPGRPFVAEVKSPRRRSAPRQLRLRSGGGAVYVSRMVPLKKRFENPTFTFKTRVLIDAAGPVEDERVGKLQREMRNAMVQYRNNKGRVVYKKVYSVKARRRGRRITAEVRLDGGLPVKRLVSGEDVSPSFSESIGTPLRCERFDIMGVWPTGSSKP